MFKFSIFLVLFVISSFLNYAQESVFDGLDYYRVYTNYNGSAFNGKSILVYGEGGVIIRSIDGGNNWMQINLDDPYKIISITNIGSDYYGVLNKKYIIKSTDNGANWQKFDYDDSTYFYKIIPYKNNLYCMSNTKIIICSQDLNKINELQFTSDTTYYDFTITANNLIYSAGHGSLGLINLQNNNKKLLNLRDMGICTDCPVISNLFSDGNITYFNLKNTLYQYDGNNVKEIFYPIKAGIYTANNGEVFEIYNIINYSTNLDSMYFVKLVNLSAIQIREKGMTGI